jgi:hypothetical protein
MTQGLYMPPQNTEYTTLNLNYPVYTTVNFWYGTDKIGTRTTFLVQKSGIWYQKSSVV